MKAEPFSPRALDRSFWLRIGGMAMLVMLAFYGLISGSPGHPIYLVATVLIAFAGACQLIARYTGDSLYRDVYLVLLGLVLGILATPFLSQWFVV